MRLLRRMLCFDQLYGLCTFVGRQIPLMEESNGFGIVSIITRTKMNKSKWKENAKIKLT